MDVKEIAKGVDWTFLTKIMENNDFTKSTPWEVIQFVYQATWLKYRMLAMEHKAYADKLEQKVIAKNGELDQLMQRISLLESAMDEAGVPIPEAGGNESKDKTN